jgi:DNA-binding NarL/FixJ family response regulator
MSNPSQNNILVVDDHPFFRKGLIEWIESQTNHICCGEADSFSSAFEAVLKYNPDLVILDLRLGSEDGLELLKQLIARKPELRILVVSQHDEIIFADRAIKAGAMGYVLKDEIASEFKMAIEFALRGEIFVCRKMSSRLLHHFCLDQKNSLAGPMNRLSDRELQVFRLIGAGVKTSEIASDLRLSVKTVETYRENLKNKLNLPNAAALAKAAVIWVREGKAPS